MNECSFNIIYTKMMELLFNFAKILVDLCERFVYIVFPILILHIIVWKFVLANSEFIKNIWPVNSEKKREISENNENNFANSANSEKSETENISDQLFKHLKHE